MLAVTLILRGPCNQSRGISCHVNIFIELRIEFVGLFKVRFAGQGFRPLCMDRISDEPEAVRLLQLCHSQASCL